MAVAWLGRDSAHVDSKEACVYDLGPEKSLAAVCEELGFELEGES